MWRKRFLVCLAAAVVCLPAAAQNTSTAAVPPEEQSEDLIYSVDRTPEREFDTSRADTVVTARDIKRANKTGLAQLLEEQAGIVVSARPSGGTPVIRGLSDKQVMILVDGIKVNDATSGGLDIREYLNLIALDSIERIEIVRGVVSVLGTESLGGVINIITKKASPDKEAFGGWLGTRYASGDRSFSAPVQVYGDTHGLRFTAGGTLGTYGDVRSPDIGRQPSGYHQTEAYANGQYLISHEKSLNFGYQQVRQTNLEWPATTGLTAGRSLTLGSLAYQDLTTRWWADSVRIAGYVNRQINSADIVYAGGSSQYYDNDGLRGANLELGKFVGSHHLVYGVDYSGDKVRSWSYGPDATGAYTLQRGTHMDRATYRAEAAYLQDRFDPWKWLTVIAGARYGRFKTSGHETTFLGPTSLDGQHGDTTGALNLIAHVTPQLNVIGNVFRGFRSPNLDDMSKFGFRTTTSGFGVEVENPQATPEHVMSYELGAKYDNGRFEGAAYAYRNRLTDLLAVTNIGFLDLNQNGKKDGFDFDLFQNRNVGRAIIKGLELESRLTLGDSNMVWGHASKTVGTDTATNQPLDFIPGLYGALGYRFMPAVAHLPWVEAVWRHQSTQHRLGAVDLTNPLFVNGIEGFDVIGIRGGANVTDAFSITAGVENVTNEKYREIGSVLYAPARQLVLSTRYTF